MIRPSRETNFEQIDFVKKMDLPFLNSIPFGYLEEKKFEKMKSVFDYKCIIIS